MNELFEQILKIARPAFVPVIIGLLSAAMTVWVMIHNLDYRVSILEVKFQAQEPFFGRMEKLETTIERHEKALDRDFARHEATVADISHKTEDQEKRLTRLEALFTETQTMLSEIRSDVKILLRGGQQ